MSTRFLLIILPLCVTLLGLPIQDRTLDKTAVSELASALGIPADADLIAETQKQWLRPPNKERWEVVDNFSEESHRFILEWAEKEQFFAAWRPLYKQYDQAIILGATIGRMQTRLNYLKTLWSEGIRFSKVVWLTGDRPLDPRVEPVTEPCTTESDAARLLWEETDLPPDMHALPITFITVPMKQLNGRAVRPNTADTVIAWRDTHPAPCTLVVVSNQPYCGYQFAVIKALLPDAYSFDLVGPATYTTAASTILDTVARWIYQENLMQVKTTAVE